MITELKQIVAKYMQIEPEEIDEINKNGKLKHTQESVLSRYLICYILREKTGYSLGKIGECLELNHATVHHGLKVVKNEAETNVKFKQIRDAVMYEVDILFEIPYTIKQDVERQIMSYFT